jgi:hypothetical protein
MKQTNAPNELVPTWDLIDPNYSLVRKHYVILLYLYLLPGMVALLGTTMLGSPKAVNGTLELTSTQITGLVIALCAIVWQLINSGPSLYFQLRAVRGKTTTLREIYRGGLPYSWRAIKYYLCFGVGAFVGLLLFILPGLIFVRRYMLGTYYLVDRNLTVGEALQASARTSKTYSKGIWGLIGVQAAFISLALLFEWSLGIVGSVISLIIIGSIVFLMPLRYREITAKKV